MASKKPVYGSHSHEGDQARDRKQGRKKNKDQSRSQEERQGQKPGRQAGEAAPVQAAGAGKKNTRGRKNHKGGEAQTQPKPMKQTKPARALPTEQRDPIPAPRQKKGRNRRPMEVPLRLGNQKDSTERQDSLMKPYYFNPYED